MTTNFSPYKSTVTDETLVRFLNHELDYNLTSVPGIGPKAKEILTQNGVTNTFQLVAKFLSFKEDDGDDTDSDDEEGGRGDAASEDPYPIHTNSSGQVG